MGDTRLPVAVPAAVVGACREILLTPMLMTTGTKTMECLLRIAHRRFGVIHPFGLGFPDVGNAEIHGFVAGVTAANRLVYRTYRVVASDAIHIVKVAVTLVRESYRTELGCQLDHGLFGRDCFSRGHERRRKPQQEQAYPG